MRNQLAHERSPYLRQHQHNPVHWLPWGTEALDLAKAQNKLVVVSIGYSACHWCHVMERESFENHAVAAVMNEHYISIKVDREERPDVDQIYMLAVQLMTQSGGWPLNCICLPDGRPIYGGTYFRTADWIQILNQIQSLWENDPQTAIEYAEKLEMGIKQSEGIPLTPAPAQYSADQLREMLRPWKELFDPNYGGLRRAPKFPVPGSLGFLLQYGVLGQDEVVVDHVHFSLIKIAGGGIYDHVGGGFARYAVDERWHVPHFEKMLYDNAQLVNVYLAAWLHKANPIYRQVIEETLNWVAEEMTDDNGGFYCALDADSEGVEGKYYTFTLGEFEGALRQNAEFTEEDIQWLADYFHCTPHGNWVEERTNVLWVDYAQITDELTASMTASAEDGAVSMAGLIYAAKTSLKHYRSQRVRPGLDDKQLTSWNALMLTAYCEAYRVLGNPDYLEIAKKNGSFFERELLKDEGGIRHQPIDNQREISGFLDDYAYTIEAFIALYECTFDEKWLHHAKDLAAYAVEHFWSEESAVFYYTEAGDASLVARKAQLLDDVMPSSNATLLRQLKKLGSIFDIQYYQEIVDRVLPRMLPQMQRYGSAHWAWGILLMEEVHGTTEIILTGESSHSFRKELDAYYIPNKLILGTDKPSEIPLLLEKFMGKDAIYVCKNRTCSLPMHSTNEVLATLNVR